MRVTKDKLMDMVNAVKNMKCMNEKGETHPFLKQPEAEKEMQPFWQNDNVRVEMLDISSMEVCILYLKQNIIYKFKEFNINRRNNNNTNMVFTSLYFNTA